MVRILTDTSSDISIETAKQMGIELTKIRIFFGDEEYDADSDPEFTQFYEMLPNAQTLPTTSQANPEDFIPLFESARDAKDSMVVLLLSSGLSGTVQSAAIAKQAVKYDEIYIIDSHQTVTGLRLLVDEAIKMRSNGATAKEISERIEAIKDKVKLYAIVDTLEYLYKGGRMTKASKIAGNLLNFKPIITMAHSLSLIGKERGTASAIKFVVDKVDVDKVDLRVPVYFGYSSRSDLCEQLKAEMAKKYPFPDVITCRVGGVVGTHVGPNACEITYLEK